jgi:hypothetical protein
MSQSSPAAAISSAHLAMRRRHASLSSATLASASSAEAMMESDVCSVNVQSDLHHFFVNLRSTTWLLVKVNFTS